MGVEDEASRYAMEATDEIKEGVTEVMPTATPDPSETGGVVAMRTGKGKPSPSAGIVARKATESECWKTRADLERTGPEEPEGSGRARREIGSARTRPKDPEEPEKGLSS